MMMLQRKKLTAVDNQTTYEGCTTEPRDEENKLKWCEIQITRDDLMVKLWKDKKDIHMLMNICDEPAQDNFCDEQGNTMKQLAVRQDG
jgi:hypothetical protein